MPKLKLETNEHFLELRLTGSPQFNSTLLENKFFHMFLNLLKLSKRRQIYYSEFKTNRCWGYLDDFENKKDKDKILNYKTLISQKFRL